MAGMLRLTLLVAAVSASVAQDRRIAIDNDQVRVLVVTQAPNQKTTLHDHKMNRVMVYLQPGKQIFEWNGGKKTALTWKAGEAKWSPAAGMHTAEIVSGQPVTIVEIELKKPADSSKRPGGPLDPVRLDPKKYKVLFENDQTRVLHVRIDAGKSVPMHEHALNRVITHLSDVKLRATTPDGKTQIVERKAGDVSWWPAPSKHQEENLNDTRFEVVVVELKT